MKTVEDWLKELPEPIRSKALTEHEKPYMYKATPNTADLLDALTCAFSWQSSDQGYSYWRHVSKQLADGVPPQELKEPE